MLRARSVAPPEPATTPPPKPTGKSLRGICFILLLALVLRLIWIHDPGYTADIEEFTVPWMRTAAHEDLGQVYERYEIVYPPASIALLGLVGKLSGSPAALGAITPVELFFLKLTNIFFDLLLAASLFRLGLSVAGQRVGLAGALLFALCPPFIFIGGWWGQIDGWFIFFMFISVWAIARNRTTAGWVALGIALAFKVQTTVILPLTALLTWRHAGLKRLAIGIVAFIAAFLLFAAPLFGDNPQTPLFRRISETARDFPYISAQGHNLWFALTPAARGRGLDIHSDLNATPLGISYRDAGLALLAAGYSGLLILLFIRRDRRLAFIGAAMAWLLFFMLPTRIHARFLLPALPFLVAAGFYARRWWWLFAGYSLTLFVNLLERAGPLSPWADWLTITPGISVANAWINVGMFVVAWVWLVQPAATDERPVNRWASLARWEKGFVTLWVAALLAGIGLVWWRGYETGKEIAAWSTGLPAALTSRLEAADPSQTLIVNWPRSVWSEARLFGLVPVTPPATFMPLPEEIAPEATWFQYTPWQEPSAWEIVYHGRSVTEDELRAAAERAQEVLAFRPQSRDFSTVLRHEPVTADPPCPVEFSGGICLVNAALDISNPAEWALDLTWYPVETPQPGLTVFVHGLAADGSLQVQADGLPGRGLSPIEAIARSGQALRETRFLPATEPLARVRIGLYDSVTGARLPVSCAPELECAADAVEIAP